MSYMDPRPEGLNTQPAPPSVVETLTRRTEAEYLTHDLFMGEEADIKCRTVKLVTARKPHACWLGQALGAKPHEIAVGELHRYEKALVDGDYWGSYRCCLRCMDAEIDDVQGTSNGDDK
ncbi:hypothetical protein PIN31009_01866 [Pandoraea iniqua]|uniref:hypothetical protein n=1 Tax=Pandoraea iniqua TaxID=2508288 RepID=UPI0012410BA0|nr:hypothetical protein [Pandoraea iniqua]VVD95752.1 hypothetical protein PIN31009_01866 [Pandoraea iniqua]